MSFMVFPFITGGAKKKKNMLVETRSAPRNATKDKL